MAQPPKKPTRRVHLREVLFELQVYGRYVRISAIDPYSNTEVMVVGDASQPEAVLKNIAKRKLEYVMTKKLPPEPGDDGKGGILV